MGHGHGVGGRVPASHHGAGGHGSPKGHVGEREGTSGAPRLDTERVFALREGARGGSWTVRESSRWPKELDQVLVQGS